MSWINSRQFQIANRNGRHYVFRRNNAGNTEINIPKTITTKAQAVTWLKAHPEKVAKPNRRRAKGQKSPRQSGLRPFERMINGKKMIKFTNKEGKVYYRPAPPTPPGVHRPAPNRKRVIVAPLHPAFNPFANAPPPPPPPPGGWKYPAPPTGGRPYKKLPNRPVGNEIWNMTCDHLKASLKSMTPLGKGRQGIVYEAEATINRQKRAFAVKVAPRDLMAARRGERQPVDIEFSIQDAVQIVTPNVVRVYKSMRCENFIAPAQMNMPNVQNTARYDKSKQGILLIELASGGSLSAWLKKQTKVDDATMKRIISDVLGALFAIQKKFPYFRHNDLYMQNVFVADRGFLIGDFGWARLEKMGTNPAVNTANGTKTASFWGVGPKTDERYDQHLFLNELLEWAQKHSPADHPKAIEFLKMAIPAGYRGMNGEHMIEGRLKYGDPCPELPYLAEVLSYPFLAGKKRVSSPNLKAAKAKLRPAKVKRISSVNLQKAKAKLKPANRRKPGRLITSAQLRKAAAKLKRVARPKPKPRITGYNLRAAKAKLRKVKKNASPARVPNATARKATAVLGGGLAKRNKHKPIPREVLRSTKFNKMIETIWKAQNKKANESFNNAWSRARVTAINKIQARINNNKPPFTPSPPKRANLPPPLSPIGPPPKPKAKAKRSARNNLGMKLSPSSGRVKIKAPNSGRLVYANGATVSLQYLKNMAARYNVNIKGMRSKANIARKIFG